MNMKIKDLITYDPSNADSIVSAVLEWASPFTSQKATFKKGSNKSLAVSKFKEISNFFLEKNKSEVKEELRQKWVPKVDRLFLNPMPYFLYFVSEEDDHVGYEEIKTTCIRKYIERNLSDLSNHSNVSQVLELLRNADKGIVDYLSELSADADGDTVAASEHNKALNEIGDLKNQLKDSNEKAVTEAANASVLQKENGAYANQVQELGKALDAAKTEINKLKEELKLERANGKEVEKDVVESD